MQRSGDPASSTSWAPRDTQSWGRRDDAEWEWTFDWARHEVPRGAGRGAPCAAGGGVLHSWRPSADDKSPARSSTRGKVRADSLVRRWRSSSVNAACASTQWRREEHGRRACRGVSTEERSRWRKLVPTRQCRKHPISRVGYCNRHDLAANVTGQYSSWTVGGHFADPYPVDHSMSDIRVGTVGINNDVVVK